MREILAKTLLSAVKQPEPWFGLRYNMNLYRGCQHGCIYCDTRSECYGIDDLSDVAVKVNAFDLLQDELPRKRVKGTIGFGSMNDCYQPLEADLRMTRRALEIIARHGFPVHILTKSDLVVRDLDLLQRISGVYAAVSFTVTTADDELAQKLEPGAPLPSWRYAAMAQFSAAGVCSGVMMMPVLPFIEDNEENVQSIVRRTAEAGGSYIVAGLGMTLRDRQREYYYAQLDRLFPGLRQKYERRFGERYSCAANGTARLEAVFREACARYGIVTRIPLYGPQAAVQGRLL
ncbi:MAG: radical SAM protein [Chloroflexi bacterium]|nr:radical SAM protein [Chloroflexota bacterium]